MAKFLKFIRTTHSWFGIIALPWVIFFGFTGFYLNHENAVLSLFERQEFDESVLRDHRLEEPLSAEEAADIAREYWPDSPMKTIDWTNYHGFETLQFERDAGLIIVAVNTGHYYTKSKLRRTTYAPDGTILERKIYWNYVFGVFHRTGWLGWGLGTILADMTSIALIVFGVTGIILWYLPRHRRLKRRVHAWFSKEAA